MQFTPDAEKTSKPVFAIDSGGHNADITQLAYVNRYDSLVSSSKDQTIRIWSINSLEPTRRIFGEYKPGQEGAIYDFKISPDNRFIASVGRIGSGSKRESYIRIHDFLSGEMVALLKGHKNSVNNISFSFDGKYLLSSDFDGKIFLWDVENYHSNNEFKRLSDFKFDGQGFIKSMFTRYDDSNAVVALFSDRISAYKVNKETERKDVNFSMRSIVNYKLDPLNSIEFVKAKSNGMLAVSDKLIAIALTNNAINIYDVKLHLTKTIKASNKITALALYKNDGLIAIGSDNGCVSVYDTLTGNILYSKRPLNEFFVNHFPVFVDIIHKRRPGG